MAPETLTLSITSPETPLLEAGLRRFYNATEPSQQIIHSTKVTEYKELAVRPSIKFEPDRADYEARTKRIVQKGLSHPSLPEGYPSRISGERVWDGNDVGGVDGFAQCLSLQEIDEIEDALAYFKG